MLKEDAAKVLGDFSGWKTKIDDLINAGLSPENPVVLSRTLDTKRLVLTLHLDGTYDIEVII